MHIFVDLESGPTLDEEQKKQIADGVHPPANYKKPDTIAKWYEENGADAVEKAWRATALDGTWGRLLCFGYALDNDAGAVVLSNDDERELLVEVMETLRNIAGGQLVVFVGHNVAWDLRFLHHRCVIHNVKPTVHIPYNDPPHRGSYMDTMYAWCGTRDHIKLTDLCRALQIESDDTLTGSGVYDAWQAGEYDRVREHARADVERVRSVYRRLSFSSAPDVDIGSSRHSTTTPAMSSASGD